MRGLPRIDAEELAEYAIALDAGEPPHNCDMGPCDCNPEAAERLARRGCLMKYDESGPYQSISPLGRLALTLYNAGIR